MLKYTDGNSLTKFVLYPLYAADISLIKIFL